MIADLVFICEAELMKIWRSESFIKFEKKNACKNRVRVYFAILLCFLPKLRWSSSARTKEHKNKQCFYLHIFRWFIFKFLYFSRCLGAQSKHIDISY